MRGSIPSRDVTGNAGHISLHQQTKTYTVSHGTKYRTVDFHRSHYVTCVV